MQSRNILKKNKKKNCSIAELYQAFILVIGFSFHLMTGNSIWWRPRHLTENCSKTMIRRLKVTISNFMNESSSSILMLMKKVPHSDREIIVKSEILMWHIRPTLFILYPPLQAAVLFLHFPPVLTTTSNHISAFKSTHALWTVQQLFTTVHFCQTVPQGRKLYNRFCVGREDLHRGQMERNIH